MGTYCYARTQGDIPRPAVTLLLLLLTVGIDTAFLVGQPEMHFVGQAPRSVPTRTRAKAQSNPGVTQKTFLEYLSQSDYDPLTPPHQLEIGNDSISVEIALRRVSDLQQSNQQFSVDIDVMVYWKDPELVDFQEILDATGVNLLKVSGSYVPELVFDTVMPHVVWYPTLIFPTIRQISKADETTAGVNEFVRLTLFLPSALEPADHVFTLYRHVVGTTSCAMDFHRFPFDTQNCAVPVVVWEKGLPVSSSILHADFVPPASGSSSMATFILDYSFQPYIKYRLPEVSRNNSATSANYPGCQFTVTMKRNGGHFGFIVFVPITLITLMALSSLFIDTSVMPARVALEITSMLSLVALTFPMTADLPVTPYENYVTMYNAISTYFIFASVISTVLVHFLRRMHELRGKSSKPAPGVPAACGESPLWQGPLLSCTPQSVLPPPLIKPTPPPEPKVKPFAPLWMTMDYFFAGFLPTAYFIVIIVFFSVTASTAG